MPRSRTRRCELDADSTGKVISIIRVIKKENKSKEKSHARKFSTNLGGTLMHNVHNIVGVIISNTIIMQFRRAKSKNIPTDDEVPGAPSMLKNTVDVDPRRGQFSVNLDLFSSHQEWVTMEIDWTIIPYKSGLHRCLSASYGLTDMGQVAYCKRDYYITELLNNSYRFISRPNMESLKPTPRVILRLGGYNDMTRELRVIGGNDNPVPEDTATLMKI
ncbi:hypothetical protein VPH35_019170 [Triticum aestivum]